MANEKNETLPNIKEIAKNIFGKVTDIKEGLRNIKKKPEVVPNVKVGIRG